MTQRPLGPLAKSFASLTGPRVERRKHHRFLDIVLMAIGAMTRTHRPTVHHSNDPAGGWCGVCGAEGWVEVAAFGKIKKKWLRRSLALPHGISSRDTFGRVFAALGAGEFQRCFFGVGAGH